jgi:DNA-binding response OmpR family regulator
VPNHKVLVIDDSRVIRMRVREMLPETSFEILEASDGLEGVNMIRNENPNLILLDFLLPKMSGWDVFQSIQKEEQWRSTPLVIMSGRKEEVLEKLPEPFDSFSFVEKPFDQKQLAAAIRDAMLKAKTQINASPATSKETTTTEIQQLQQTIATMQSEINTLKRQMAQLVNYIKQKL